MQLLKKYGIEHASSLRVREIAYLAGITSPLIYLHFKDRAELVALAVSSMLEAEEQMQAAAAELAEEKE